VTFGAILVLAIGLAMDATAVAASRGMMAPRIGWRQVAIVAVLFGGFQALMPMIGWLIGERIGPLVRAWDHWIAFGLLAAIGGKMIWEAWKGGQDDPVVGDPFGLRVMVVLAIATSIDALAAGLTLPMLNAPFVLSLVTIGVTTAVLSALGLFAGRRFGAMLGKRLDVLGGVVLIGLGAKILFEHLSGAA
jgi:putative Mn2+ efflux pump MntP